MKKFISAVTVAALIFGVAGCTAKESPTPTASQEPEVVSFSVGMVTDVGGVNDQSFNQSAWEGLQQLETDYGYTPSVLESVQESNYGPNLDQMVDGNNDLIWGIGFMMGDAIYNAAVANPDQMFGIVDNSYGPDTPDNVIGVVFRAQEPSFLVGYMAAKTTTTGKIGFIGGISGEVIDQFEYGYRAGAAYANKDVEVMVQYADSFADDAKGKAIATSMYTSGADIVFHAAGGVGMGVIAAADDMNKIAIGVDRDQAYLAPDNVMSSALKLVGQAMYDVSRRVASGEDLGGQTLAYGIAEGACGIPAYEGSTAAIVNEEIYNETMTVQDDIKAGIIVPPYNVETFDAYVAGL